MHHKRFFAVLALTAALLPLSVFADAASDVAATRAALQNQLDQLNAQIAEQQQLLEQRQSESASFQRDVDVLNAQIQKDLLSIKARDLSIQGITSDIGEKNQTLFSLDDKHAKELESLAAILRQTNALDQHTFAEFLLSSGDVASFYQDLDSFANIQSSIQSSFTEIADTEDQTNQAKSQLESQRAEQEQLRQEQLIQEKQVENDKGQEQNLLAVSKANEGKAQNAIATTQKLATQIEAELFTLRDSAPIPFGQALSYASAASKATGVPSAFILATLKQESDLGENVGACYVTNLSTGDGVGKNTGTFFPKVMKAPRDTGPFQTITAALGIPWATAPVSCPQSSGYGGAMGPSQFIPSTWQLYQNRLSTALGVSTPNPWNARDAIMATAFLMEDNGAAAGTYTAERNAACKYYSGKACTSSTAFYGDEVMDNTAYFQNQIDIINS